MTPREIARHHVHALNQHGIKVDMTIVEREGQLVLRDGLASYGLTALPVTWTAPELEAEIKSLTGAVKVVVM